MEGTLHRMWDRPFQKLPHSDAACALSLVRYYVYCPPQHLPIKRAPNIPSHLFGNSMTEIDPPEVTHPTTEQTTMQPEAQEPPAPAKKRTRAKGKKEAAPIAPTTSKTSRSKGKLTGPGIRMHTLPFIGTQNSYI